MLTCVILCSSLLIYLALLDLRLLLLNDGKWLPVQVYNYTNVDNLINMDPCSSDEAVLKWTDRQITAFSGSGPIVVENWPPLPSGSSYLFIIDSSSDAQIK